MVHFFLNPSTLAHIKKSYNKKNSHTKGNYLNWCQEIYCDKSSKDDLFDILKNSDMKH